MSARKAIQIGCALALGLVMYLPAARADILHQEISLTFTKPVQVSDNVILPPGTYSMRLADGTSMPQKLVQIFDDRGVHVTNVETETADRGVAPLRVLGNHDYSDFIATKVELAQGPDHDTLMSYFFRGEAEGHRFAYSGPQERMLSEEPTVTVMATPRHHRGSQTLSASNAQ